MKILMLVLVLLLIMIPPVAMGSVELPKDLDSFIGLVKGTLNWWLMALRSFLRTLATLVD